MRIHFDHRRLSHLLNAAFAGWALGSMLLIAPSKAVARDAKIELQVSVKGLPGDCRACSPTAQIYRIGAPREETPTVLEQGVFERNGCTFRTQVAFKLIDDETERKFRRALASAQEPIENFCNGLDGASIPESACQAFGAWPHVLAACKTLTLGCKVNAVASFLNEKLAYSSHVQIDVQVLDTSTKRQGAATYSGPATSVIKVEITPK